MSELLKYQIWCATDSKWEYTWAEEDDAVPTTCPTDTAHTIDSTKTTIDEVVEKEVVDQSGRQKIHQSSKPIGTTTHFTGEGDDVATSPTTYGGGTVIKNAHAVSDGMSQSIYIDFNFIENKSWLHEGYLQWRNAEFDMLTMDICPITTTNIAGTNTNYNNGDAVGASYLIIPASGDGVIDMTATLSDHRGGLVYMPDAEDGTPPVAFWNADWNTSTKVYENIIGAPSGNGRYNLFNTEVPLNRFVNKMQLLGNGFMKIQTSDVSQLGNGMRIKFVADTIGADHAWDFATTLVIDREKTV